MTETWIAIIAVYLLVGMLLADTLLAKATAKSYLIVLLGWSLILLLVLLAYIGLTILEPIIKWKYKLERR